MKGAQVFLWLLSGMFATAASAIDGNLWSDVGNIGIGTTSPIRQLHVRSGTSGSVNYVMRLDSGTGSVGTAQMIETTLNTQFGAVNDATSTYSFQLRNGANTKLYVGSSGTYDGRVGIGTTTPTSSLDLRTAVDGPVVTIGIPSGYGVGIPSSHQINMQTYDVSFGGFRGPGPSSDQSFQVINSTTGGSKLFVGTDGPYGGNVGIGTTTPTKKLEVNGTVKAKEVWVTADVSNWPDFVFDEKYELRPLPEIAAYIANHHHLPDMPSVEQAASGIAIGEMQTLLLRKVEELTLHAIALERSNTELRTRLSALEETR